MEIIVVDDGSEPPLSVGGPDVRLIRRDHSGGVSAAFNTGIREVQADILVLLGDDIFPEPALWAPLLAVLEANEHSWVAPRIVLPGEEPDRDGDEVLEVEDLPSGLLLTRRATFTQVGEFDEELDALTDFELTVRARQLGHRLLIVPSCVAVHDDSRSTFRRNALRYHRWIELTPPVWKKLGGGDHPLTEFERSVYCTALYPRRRLLAVVGRMLRPEWIWRLYLRLLPAELKPTAFSRILASTVHARAARRGLRRLEPPDRRRLCEACLAQRNEPRPGWVLTTKAPAVAPHRQR
jgi:GT2 family glycosyltransferase